MKDIKFKQGKNPTPDGKPQFDYVTEEEFQTIYKLLTSDPEIMTSIKDFARRSEAFRHYADENSLEANLYPATRTWDIGTIIEDVTNRTGSGRLSVAVVFEIIKMRSI